MNIDPRKMLLFLSVVLITVEASSQYGASFLYNKHLGADNWDEFVVGDEHVKANGYGLSVDYWFRLKNYRIEFSPEIGYLKGDHELMLESGDVPNLNWSQFFVLANINIYPFDIEGDCNCPTFGKDGNFFQKGFFIQFAPGLSIMNTNYEILEVSEEVKSNSLLVSIGGGIDFGLSDYITLTPFIRYVHGVSHDWRSLTLEDISSETGDVMTGIHVVYRLDYKKRRF